MDKKDMYVEAQQIIEKRRLEAEKAFDNKMKILYQESPKLEKLQGQIEENMLLIMKEIAAGNSDILSLRKKQEALAIEKKKIFDALHIEERELKPVYTCLHCEDTGYVANEVCRCFKQIQIDIAYHHANLEYKFEQENFETFDFGFYSQQIDPRYDMSSQDAMIVNVSRAKEFAKDFHQTKNHLLLSGDTGLGKTFLCNAIAKEVLDQGFVVFYVTAGHLFSAIEKLRFSGVEEKNKLQDVSETAIRSDLLIIDDLGTEFSTTVTRSALFTIVNDRLIYNKPMIISTNLSIQDIRDAYTDRITSRIVGEFELLPFFGNDIREIKKYNLL